MQHPLYVEHYCLFVPETSPYADKPSVTWTEAAQEPLCLLTPNMQNRRIVDRAFAVANAHPSPRLETNSIMNLLASVRSTSKCLVVHEDAQFAGFGAEIAAAILSAAFFDLDAPIERVAAPRVPVPFSADLMPGVVPDVAQIKAAMDRLLRL